MLVINKMDITTIVFIIAFLIVIFIAYRIGHKAGSFQKHKEWEEALPEHRKDAIMKSRAVLGGQF